MGDPRARQSRYLAEAGRQAEVEANLRREQKRREDDEESYRALTEELLPFETLDEEMLEWRAILDTHRPAYETYLQYGAEASQVNEREAAVQEASARVDDARKREHAVAEERAATAERYEANEHEELKVQCREISDQLVAERTTLQQVERDLRSVQDELVKLRRQQDKLMGLRGQLGELGSE